MELWILKMYLLEETAAAIWYRFCNYLNMKDKAFFENTTTDNTISRNIPAYDGNILTDHMLVSSYLTVYISTFQELYGITHTMIEHYSGMYPNLIVIIIFTKKLQNWKEWYKYSTNVLLWLPIWHFMLLSGMKCTRQTSNMSSSMSILPTQKVWPISRLGVWMMCPQLLQLLQLLQPSQFTHSAKLSLSNMFPLQRSQCELSPASILQPLFWPAVLSFFLFFFLLCIVIHFFFLLFRPSVGFLHFCVFLIIVQLPFTLANSSHWLKAQFLVMIKPLPDNSFQVSLILYLLSLRGSKTVKFAASRSFPYRYSAIPNVDRVRWWIATLKIITTRPFSTWSSYKPIPCLI